MGPGGGPKAACEVKCGVMEYNVNTHECTADRRKGLLLVKKDQGMVNLEFVDASTKQVVEGPEMIFPGDVTFAKVKQSDDRVYVLTFVQTKRRRFYWF